MARKQKVDPKNGYKYIKIKKYTNQNKISTRKMDKTTPKIGHQY